MSVVGGGASLPGLGQRHRSRRGRHAPGAEFFAIVLSHSRWLEVEFTRDQSQEWWLDGHQRAFEKLPCDQVLAESEWKSVVMALKAPSITTLS